MGVVADGGTIPVGLETSLVVAVGGVGMILGGAGATDAIGGVANRKEMCFTVRGSMRSAGRYFSREALCEAFGFSGPKPR